MRGIGVNAANFCAHAVLAFKLWDIMPPWTSIRFLI